MKFARYLQETQTPEWKKAYIDYRGLKKRITAIRRAQQGLEPPSDSPDDEEDDTAREEDGDREADTAATSGAENSIPASRVGTTYVATPLAESSPQMAPLHVDFTQSSGRDTVPRSGRYSKDLARSPSTSQSVRSMQSARVPSARSGSFLNSDGQVNSPVEALAGSPTRKPSIARMITAPLFRRASLALSTHDREEPTDAYPLPPISQALPLHILLPKLFATPDRPVNGTFASQYGTMNPGVPISSSGADEQTFTIANAHRKFFAHLDSELEKIESFYQDREKEMRARGIVLKEQLEELGDHRKMYYAAHPKDLTPWHHKMVKRIDPVLSIFHSVESKAKKAEAQRQAKKSAATHSKKPRKRPSPRSTRKTQPVVLQASSTQESAARPGSEPDAETEGSSSPVPLAYFETISKIATSIVPGLEPSSPNRHRLEPDEYLHAKKKLQKAVLEHYRGLEALNNFRILNMTGFRKALKKYEKLTKVPAQTAYMKEKVDPSAFASAQSISSMIKETEELFAARFTKNDKKRAMARLRVGTKQKSHHFSMFRSGILLGLAIPPTVAGVYASFQEDTRKQIPGWDALMLVYATFLVPVLFSLLVGLNLLVWAQARINYVFIFELDVRSRMDYREYFELPSLLIFSLAYAFWLSFALIGPPTLWPLVWLAFVVVVMIQPLPFFFKSSRFWLLRNVGKLLASGFHRVEFTDFWMGDQFCSLVFSLSNLYSIACTYHTGFHAHAWKQCSAQSPQWGIIFLIAVLPLLARFVQSIRRFFDSKLPTHLVNAGKYAAGIVYYFTYFHWRHQGSPYGSLSFVLYCLFGAFYSVYACSWDFIMDWSLLRPHSTYPLLRPDLAYRNHISLYYVTMITNIILRFSWVIYIISPHRGISSSVRSFIAAILEMFRRIAWNFYRLENEHLGNMDQYRITREVPLPYTLEDPAEYDDEDVEGEQGKTTSREWLSRARANLSPRGKGARTEAAEADGEAQT